MQCYAIRDGGILSDFVLFCFYAFLYFLNFVYGCVCLVLQIEE